MAAATTGSVDGGGGASNGEGDHDEGGGSVAPPGGSDCDEYSDGEGACKYSEPVVTRTGKLRLAKIWVANPSSSHRWTSRIGGV